MSTIERLTITMPADMAALSSILIGTVGAIARVRPNECRDLSSLPLTPPGRDVLMSLSHWTV